jgi:protein-L-isoaspartate(D-aspartate) O-methyltransferase
MESKLARKNMVDNQLRPNQISNPMILQAFATLPRELFLPPHLHAVAYVDADLPYHQDRCLMASWSLARLLELASIKSTQHTLIIGCGTGYSLAIVAALCTKVIGLESIPDLAAKARHNMHTMNLTNVTIVEGPLYEGYSLQAPYQVILIEGVINTIPSHVIEQLEDGGNLVAIQRTSDDAYTIGKGLIATKHNDKITVSTHFDVSTKSYRT